MFNAAFKKWFGKSKVVDSKGNPLVVYHGSVDESAFDKFSVRRKNYAWPDAVLGFFFSDGRKVVSAFSEGGHIVEVYLRMEKPHIVDGYAFYIMIASDRGEEYFRKWKRDLVASGFDGIIVRANKGVDKLYGPGWQQFDADTFIVFNSRQIKSVDNDGSWDIEDADIRSNPRRRR